MGEQEEAHTEGPSRKQNSAECLWTRIYLGPRGCIYETCLPSMRQWMIEVPSAGRWPSKAGCHVGDFDA